MNVFIERFLPLIEESGKTDQELEKSMNLPRSIIYDWKHGRNKSSFKKYAGNFAEFFNVSADYLLGNTDNPNSVKLDVSQETLQFMRMFESLPADKKDTVLKVMEGFIEKK